MVSQNPIEMLMLLAPVVVLLYYLTMSSAVEQPGKSMSPIMVNTALGPVPADKLGITLVHEHFAFAYAGWLADAATMAPYDFDKVLKINIDVIKKAQKYGISTIIDATTNDVGGRDPELFKALSRETGMNIICTTGLYTREEGAPAYFETRQRWYQTDIAKLISDLFISEITKGIGQSGVKTGVIKVATNGGGELSSYEASLLEAAVIAQKATGVPIITHISGRTGGVEQAEFFKKEGADLKKVMIGHVSNSWDTGYHKAILSSGVRIGFDRIGLDVFNPTEKIVQNIVDLCNEGYKDRILLSHDSVNFHLGRSPEIPERIASRMVNSHIEFISRDVIPMLKAKGLTERMILTMMSDNPRNLFTGS